jgi:malonyl-CoA O-methyltransferase
MIEQARQNLSFDNVRFRVTDITQPWPVEASSVDLVTCNLVLEHIENLGFVLSEAARVLARDGRIFISELHPFRQYRGVVARFERDHQRIEVPAFVHHISDFLNAAAANGLYLTRLEEFWHADDQDKPPRLIAFMFGKGKK